MSGDPCFNLADLRQGPIPTGLEFSRHQAVRRIDRIILSKGTIGGIPCRFKVTFQGFGHLVAVRRFLSAGLDRRGNGARFDYLENLGFDGLVDQCPAEADATRFAIAVQRLQQ